MSCFFRELNKQLNDAADISNPKIVHILDNCKVAYNKVFFELAEEEKIFIQFQAPYSPDYNSSFYLVFNAVEQIII